MRKQSWQEGTEWLGTPSLNFYALVSSMDKAKILYPPASENPFANLAFPALKSTNLYEYSDYAVANLLNSQVPGSSVPSSLSSVD